VILQLITDRRRLAPDASEQAMVRCLLQQIRHAVEGELDIVQVREHDLEVRALATLVSQALTLTRGTPTRLVVNDRLDVALACGADGVHLRGQSFAAARVRALAGPRFLIGRSVRSVDEARTAGPVDYLIAGTVWPTASKPDGHPLLGTGGLRQIVEVAAAPVLAIGGIDASRLEAVASTGASGVAAIGAWMSDGSGCRARGLHSVVRTFRGGRDLDNMDIPFPHK